MKLPILYPFPTSYREEGGPCGSAQIPFAKCISFDSKIDDSLFKPFFNLTYLVDFSCSATASSKYSRVSNFFPYFDVFHNLVKNFTRNIVQVLSIFTYIEKSDMLKKFSYFNMMISKCSQKFGLIFVPV